MQSDLLAPLQHELIPNMQASVWPSYSDPGPYYDLGWRYTVPYTIYTWGVAYRRDRVGDDDIAAQGWEALWNHDFDAQISLYDSYGDTLAVAILRNGSLEVNSGDPAVIDQAKEAVIETIRENQARLTINGVFAKLPEGEFTVAEAWSGDIVGAQWYLPKDVTTDVLGYWRPEPGETMISNDTLVIPATPHIRGWRTSSSTSCSTRSTATRTSPAGTVTSRRSTRSTPRRSWTAVWCRRTSRPRS